MSRNGERDKHWIMSFWYLTDAGSVARSGQQSECDWEAIRQPARTVTGDWEWIDSHLQPNRPVVLFHWLVRPDRRWTS